MKTKHEKILDGFKETGTKPQILNIIDVELTQEEKDHILKNILKDIYEAGAIGSHRSLSDDVATVRRLV